MFTVFQKSKVTSSNVNIHIWEAEIREFQHLVLKNDSKLLIDYQNSWQLI